MITDAIIIEDLMIKVKVAIIGAGLSGLACAYELEKNGITPEIFEKEAHIGEILELPAINLRMFDIPVKDPFKYMKEEFNLNITPHYDLNELIINSPQKTATINENVGWIIRRGYSSNSMTNQIRRLVDTPIKLNTPINYKDIQNKYDHVVIASGSLNEAKEMNIAIVKFDSWVRIATVSGEFKTDSMTVWMNTDYAKSGFGYLVPDTTTRAKLVLIVPNITAFELDSYWEYFLQTEKINYKIIKTMDLPHKVGSVKPVQIHNLYLVGFAGGFIDDIIGFGTHHAVISGLLAGKAIANNLNYNELMKPFIDDIAKMHEYRDAMDTFNNKGFDLLMTLLDTSVSKLLIYKNPLFKVTQGTPLVKLYNSLMEK